MELKARPAKYEDATQLARYKEELQRQGEQRILMWLVSPLIPRPVREFLDHIGIQYSEIHEAEFRMVAERHAISLAPQADNSAAEAPRLPRPQTGFAAATESADMAVKLRIPVPSSALLHQCIALLKQIDPAITQTEWKQQKTAIKLNGREFVVLRAEVREPRVKLRVRVRNRNEWRNRLTEAGLEIWAPSKSAAQEKREENKVRFWLSKEQFDQQHELIVSLFRQSLQECNTARER